MERAARVRLSRRLSYHLRHDPAAAGIELDPAGWADVERLLAGLAASGRPVTRAQLEDVVERSQRFELSADEARVRARYGHSVAVEPGHPAARPPPVLYHGTVAAALPGIRRHGLKPMGRQQVHLSEDPQAACRVGGRRGPPVVVEVDAAGLAADGAALRRAAPGVWLVDAVPPGRLRAPDGPAACQPGAQRPGLATDRETTEEHMTDGSVYKVIQLVGTSAESWEKAAANAVERAARSLRSLRVAEVAELDLVIEDGAVAAYRAKVNVSFKYEGE